MQDEKRGGERERVAEREREKGTKCENGRPCSPYLTLYLFLFLFILLTLTVALLADKQQYEIRAPALRKKDERLRYSSRPFLRCTVRQKFNYLINRGSSTRENDDVGTDSLHSTEHSDGVI